MYVYNVGIIDYFGEATELVYHINKISGRLYGKYESLAQWLESKIPSQELKNSYGEQSLLSLFKKGSDLSKKLAWEGDFAYGPYITFLPSPDDVGLSPVIFWKQRNNGHTFVISYLRLNYLEDGENWLAA